jgi:hypothetical protein
MSAEDLMNAFGLTQESLDLLGYGDAQAFAKAFQDGLINYN